MASLGHNELNASRLVLQLPLFIIYLSHLLNREWRCSWSSSVGDAPTTSEWSTISLPIKTRLVLEIWRYNPEVFFITIALIDISAEDDSMNDDVNKTEFTIVENTNNSEEEEEEEDESGEMLVSAEDIKTDASMSISQLPGRMLASGEDKNDNDMNITEEAMKLWKWQKMPLTQTK